MQIYFYVEESTIKIDEIVLIAMKWFDDKAVHLISSVGVHPTTKAEQWDSTFKAKSLSSVHLFLF